jgi:TM2 domain-containing membrane protein YozV
MWLIFLSRFQYFATIFNPNQTFSMRKITAFVLSLFVILTSTTAFISVPENASDAVKAGITAPVATVASKTKMSKGKLFMKILKNKFEKVAQKAKRAGDKSKVVAAILAFFLGNLGIHDFYLGNKRNGFIKLAATLIGVALMIIGIASVATTSTVTGLAALPVLAVIGYIIVLGVSIWSLIDFIRILTGSYEPVDGSYTD